MNCPRKTVLLAVPLLLHVSAALAQNPAPPPANAPAAPPPGKQAPHEQAPAKIRVTTAIVVVPVTVKDKTGNLVADLKKDEFRIFEDHVEQPIRFSAEAFPISMVVLIDNDLKKKDADQVQPSLVSIVGGMSTIDEAFVCRFDQFFHQGSGFLRDQDKLITQLKRLDVSSSTPFVGPPVGPFSGPAINGVPAPGAPSNDPALLAIKGQPTKALDDAVFAAASLLKDRSSERRRKIILLISDGQNGPKFNTHKYDETRAELLRQGIAVYGIAVGSAYFERKFNRLVEYARDTGGDIYFGARSKSFNDFYSKITEEARNQYTLTFEPKGDPGVDYHSIEVRVRREGLTILARRGYYTGVFAGGSPR